MEDNHTYSICCAIGCKFAYLPLFVRFGQLEDFVDVEVAIQGLN